MRGTAETYRVFVRDWWRWENGIKVPNPGARKTTLGRRMTFEEAREMCAEYARTHKSGHLSRKAEFEAE